MKRKSKTLERLEQLEKIDDLRYKFNENSLEVLKHIGDTVTEIGDKNKNYLHILRILSDSIDELKGSYISVSNLIQDIKTDNEITRTERKTAGHMAGISLLSVMVFMASMVIGRLFLWHILNTLILEKLKGQAIPMKRLLIVFAVGAESQSIEVRNIIFLTVNMFVKLVSMTASNMNKEKPLGTGIP